MIKPLNALGLGCLIILGLCFVPGCVTMTNKEISTQFISGADETTILQAPLTVLVWNLGYAGLGEESDFVADGGEMLRPPSREVVDKNLIGIKETLEKLEFDVALMQEVAKPGFLTRGRNVLKMVSDTLHDYSGYFSSDISTKWFPKPISLKHGLATFSKEMTEAPRITRINDEPGYIMGFIKRKYHIQELELSVAGMDWVFINIHLSAFDESANVRREQLITVLDIANSHYLKGKAVVIGGDWNMRLTDTEFPYTSSEDALFWIHDFPSETLRDGWVRVFDPEHPTVRTNERPFRKNENYTTIIDGLVISPNVKVISSKVENLDFKFSDHQPTVFTLETK